MNVKPSLNWYIKTVKDVGCVHSKKEGHTGQFIRSLEPDYDDCTTFCIKLINSNIIFFMKKSFLNPSIISYSQYIGVDMSKNEFTTALLIDNNKYKVKSYPNSSNGIQDFISQLDAPATTLITIEATGTYSLPLTFNLVRAAVPTAVLNPRQSKGFINGVLLSTTKTDEKDACGLALYGMINNPETYTIPDEKTLKVKQLQSLIAQLKKQRTMSKNKLHALQQHPVPSPIALMELTDTIEFFTKKIDRLISQICDLNEEEFKELHELATSVKGIGPAIATSLLTLTNGCKNFQNVKQLAKFLGVCPTQNESGTSLKMRGKIAKTGSSEARALLYMGARAAKLHNLACKELYERLKAKGKCHKVAMCAVSHRLVRQFFAVVTSKIPFDNEYHLKRKNNLINTKVYEN